MRVQFKQWDCETKIRHYRNDRIALELIDVENGNLVTVATVNVPDAILEPNEVCIKNWTENEGMLDCLVAQGIVTDTGKRIQSGFVNIPVCIFIPE